VGGMIAYALTFYVVIALAVVAVVAAVLR